MKFSKKLLLITTLAVAAITQSATTVAQSLVVDATFTDGTTITGSFNLNVSGYLGSFNLITQTHNTFSGYDYTLEGAISPNSPPAIDLNFFDGVYSRELHLAFEHPLTQSITYDAIDASQSYEYIGYSLPTIKTTSNFREVASGYAVVPEPETYLMFGIGLVGLASRLWTVKAKSAVNFA